MIRKCFVLLQASTDQSEVDTNIPFQTALGACSIIHLLGIIMVMCQVAWQVFIVFIPMTAISIWYQVSNLHHPVFDFKLSTLILFESTILFRAYTIKAYHKSAYI